MRFTVVFAAAIAVAVPALSAPLSFRPTIGVPVRPNGGWLTPALATRQEGAWDARELVNEYIRREAQEEGSGASWLSLLKYVPDVFSLFGGGGGNSSRRDVDHINEYVARQVALDEYIRREAQEEGSGASWLSLLKYVPDVFSLFGGGGGNSSRRDVDHVKEYVARQVVLDEYIRREAQEEGSGASWLSLLKYVPDVLGLFGGSGGNSSRRDVDHVNEYVARQVVLDEYIRREAQEEGSGASWLSFLKYIPDVLGLFGGGSGNSSRRYDINEHVTPLYGVGPVSLTTVLGGAANGAE